MGEWVNVKGDVCGVEREEEDMKSSILFSGVLEQYVRSVEMKRSARVYVYLGSRPNSHRLDFRLKSVQVAP